jgi:hypothetical protein
MSTANTELDGGRRSLGYLMGTVALWTGFLGFIGLFAVILIPTC